MATVVRTQPISRDKLAVVFKDFQTLKTFENMAFDVATTLPDASDEALAAAVAAQAAADAAQADADAALAAAAAAQADVDALALRDVPLALTDAATITSNALEHNSFSVTLGGNRTLASPTNLADGMLLNYAIRQDATGGRALAFNAVFDFGAAGTPVLSTTANAVDYLFGYYDSTSGKILATLRKADSTAASFSVHNNGTAQSIPNAAFTKLTFSTEVFDVGSKFASSTWTPPAGKPVMLVGGVALPTTDTTLTVVAVYKNGAIYKQGNQLVNGAASNAGAHVSCIDIPNGTDTYELYAFQNTGAAQNTVGSTHLTYFQGTTLTS